MENLNHLIHNLWPHVVHSLDYISNSKIVPYWIGDSIKGLIVFLAFLTLKFNTPTYKYIKWLNWLAPTFNVGIVLLIATTLTNRVARGSVAYSITTLGYQLAILCIIMAILRSRALSTYLQKKGVEAHYELTRNE